MVTHHATTINKLFIITNRKDLVDYSRKNEKLAMKSMEIEEERENISVFSMPRHWNSLQQ